VNKNIFRVFIPDPGWYTHYCIAGKPTSLSTWRQKIKTISLVSDVLETSKVLTSGHNPILSILGAVLSLIGFFALQLVFKDFDQVTLLNKIFQLV